ncbi:MAG: glycosyltransferase family 1 protein [Candidatus Sulfotelmatobacter sp.]
MRLFINSLAASAGGGLTYIRNVLPLLAQEPGLKLTVAISPSLRQEFQGLPTVEFVESAGSTARRFWQEQSRLPNLIRMSGSHVSLSTGNFALRRSPVPQILLSRNSIYCSGDYYSDLITRGEYRLWVETRLRALLARRSIQWADVTVAPSQAFADELHRWTGKKIAVIYHGFDRKAFCCTHGALSEDVQRRIAETEGCLRLLFVSHYNYYRNFETLFKALPIVRRGLSGRKVTLLLTCTLNSNENPGSYRAERASALVRELGVADEIVELGAVPYHLLHHVYSASDIYVTPAYAETFAHPLVEAMSSGVPIVASDLPVHREVCEKSAVYFSTFSPEALAHQILQVANVATLRREMAEEGQRRCLDFSWRKHVAQLLSLAESISRNSAR